MKNFNDLCKKNFTFYLILFTTASLILSLLLIIDEHIWYDEAYTLALIKHSFFDICRITAADVHPPLYYVLLKFFAAPFKYSPIAGNIFSIIPFLITIGFGGYQLKELFTKKVAVLFMMFFMLYPFFMRYTIEIRMYSLAAMFVFLAAIYSYKSVTQKKIHNWICFGLFGTGAAYSHYFAFVSIGIIYFLVLVYILLKNKRLLRYYLIPCAILTVLYTPWLKCFIDQLAYKANNPYWIKEITLRTLVKYGYYIFSAKGMYGFIIFPLFMYLYSYLSIIRSKNKTDILISSCALAVPFGTILVGVIVSLIVRPVFAIRYVIPATPLLVFFLAFAVSKIKSRELFGAIITIVLIGGVCSIEFLVKQKDHNLNHYILIKDFVSEYDYADSYLQLDKNYFSASMSIYSTKMFYAYTGVNDLNSPFQNLKYIEDFDHTKNDTIILFTVPEQEIPEPYKSLYHAEYKGIVDENTNFFDAYLLTKQPVSQ